MPYPPTPDPEIINIIRQFQTALHTLETPEIITMTKKWLELEAILNIQIDNLTTYIARAQEAGQTVSRTAIYNLQQYRELVVQIDEQVGNYAIWSADLIGDYQRTYGELGIRSAEESVNSLLMEYFASDLTYNKLPLSAVESMVGLAGDGSTLVTHLSKSIPDSVAGVTQALIEGITTGRNPVEVARWMRDGLGLGLNRALNIARTEQLRVYREANRESYKASGIVRGYKRLSAKDDRTCAGCLFSDGMTYQLAEAFEDHPQGRCTLVPILVAVEAPEWETGQQWFVNQPESVQRQIVGNGRFELWKNGDVTLSQMVTRKTNSKWGNSLIPTPLYKLQTELAVTR